MSGQDVLLATKLHVPRPQPAVTGYLGLLLALRRIPVVARALAAPA
jgi:hypothetical protein